MIRKVMQIHRMEGYSEIRQNLEYWLSRPPEERLSAVEELRREYYGDSHRLQRVARVMTLEEFTADKDAADIEALGGE